MDKIDGQVQFSANDLMNHLACQRLTELNHDVASDLRSAPVAGIPNWRCCESVAWPTNKPTLSI